MRTTFIRLAIAIVLAAGAWLSWSEARLTARRADATEHVITLRHIDVDRDLDAHTTATAAYWLGQYDAIAADTGGAEADAHVLRTAANAAFREALRDLPGTGIREPGSVVQRFDGVLNAYASALKASMRDIDAAYNYEYVARLRDQIARSQGKGFKPPAVKGAQMAGDLPAGPTIHGAPGAPPPEAKMEDLQMLAPMEYGDREAQPEATPGAKRERKG